MKEVVDRWWADLASASDERPGENLAAEQVVAFRQARIDDAQSIWRLARACPPLEVNSAYVYLLWCRDFFSTSIVAHMNSELIGFVTGYRRPTAPETVMIWQAGVSAAARRRGLAAAMIRRLVDVSPGVSYLEATVTEDNLVSSRLLYSLADGWSAPIDEEVLFPSSAFAAPHAAERLYRIGPLGSDVR